MNSLVDSILDKPDVVSGTAADTRKFGMLDRNRSLYSDALFSQGDEVFIQHQGAEYRLRRTRNGKLILTK